VVYSARGRETVALTRITAVYGAFQLLLNALFDSGRISMEQAEGLQLVALLLLEVFVWSSWAFLAGSVRVQQTAFWVQMIAICVFLLSGDMNRQRMLLFFLQLFAVALILAWILVNIESSGLWERVIAALGTLAFLYIPSVWKEWKLSTGRWEPMMLWNKEIYDTTCMLGVLIAGLILAPAHTQINTWFWDTSFLVMQYVTLHHVILHRIVVPYSCCPLRSFPPGRIAA
jgi:hypothetical protein